MKRAILTAAVFILTAALHAQTIAGTWQGTLPIAPTGQGTGGPGTTIPRITLRLAGINPQNPVSSDDVGNALVLAAQHAGFKLVSRKEPLPVVIVDHIDPPTPN